MEMRVRSEENNLAFHKRMYLRYFFYCSEEKSHKRITKKAKDKNSF